MQVLQEGYMSLRVLKSILHRAAVGSILFNTCASSNVQEFALIFDLVVGFSEVFCDICKSKSFVEILGIEDG